MTTKKLLIDGDALVWTATEACQEETWWDSTNNLRTAACNVDAAADNVAGAINALATQAMADDVLVVIGPDTKAYWRCLLWPDYKKHRRRADAPVGLAAVRDRIRSEWGAQIQTALPHEEADDVLAWHMTKPDRAVKPILWSPDKDMMQVPGIHFNVESGFTTVSSLEADYMHMYQTLVGDATDGYPGCHGVGPVKAKQILDITKQAQWWPEIVKAYKKAEFPESFALNQARVARILRYGEEPMKWTP